MDYLKSYIQKKAVHPPPALFNYLNTLPESRIQKREKEYLNHYKNYMKITLGYELLFLPILGTAFYFARYKNSITAKTGYRLKLGIAVGFFGYVSLYPFVSDYGNEANYPNKNFLVKKY